MILFLDIETTQSPENFNQLSADGQYAFKKRFRKEIEDADMFEPEHELYRKNGALFAEYGKIVCLSMGYIIKDQLRIKTLSGTEKEILNHFAVISNSFDFLCAHNGMEFDFAFLTRKFFIHRITPPRLLNNFGKKPWDMALIDTGNIWKASGVKYYASLAQIAFALGVPSPKDAMEGHEVPKAYYDNRLDEIITYCEKDIVALVNIFRIMRNESAFEESQIEYINYHPL